jgi:tetraacyldisaccharide 4'-kinase
MEHLSRLHRFFAIFLWPFSLVYCMGFALVHALHRCGILPAQRFATPVVSVGNITVGGTGKTPFVIYLSNLFTDMHRKSAIVSRGYRHHSEEGIIDLEKRERADGGDEPWLISIKTGVPVIVSDKKRNGCAYAIKTYQPEVLVLDDGFQSFSIHRDMDIVLIDATQGISTPLLIPAGIYRENLSALLRADVIILTRCNQVGEKTRKALKGSIRRVIRTIPLFTSSHEVLGLVSAPSDRPMEPAMLKGKRIMGISAIGNNRSFLHSLSALGLNPVCCRSYLDHHRYTAGDIAVISEEVVSYAAAAIVTTEKDLYTLRSFAASLPVPLYALSITITVDDGDRFVQCCKRKGVL